MEENACFALSGLLLSAPLAFTAEASLGATPAYSVDLVDPFAGKEVPSPSLEGVRTHTLRSLTLLDAPRYPDDFNHFNYAEPNARNEERCAPPRSARFTIWRLSSFNKAACRYGLYMSSFSRLHAMTRFHLIH